MAGRASSSSWVLEMEKLLEDTRPSVEMARWKQHSIYRVPEFIKKMTNRDAYQPQFVSLGPLHHGEPHLLPMEEHKRRAVLHMVKRARKPLTKFVEAIEEVADELEAAYDGLDDRWRGASRGSFVEMMVTDGCFLLELMRIKLSRVAKDDGGGEVDTGYAANDPVFSGSSFHNLWPIMRNDMIAMENQIPLIVLQRIVFSSGSDTPPSARWINNTVRLLLCGLSFEEGMDNLGLHFLDILHKGYCGTRPYWEWSENYEARTPCAVELSEAGIQFKKSNTESIHDVDFVNGVLSMPLLRLDDQTEMVFLNLMAFEWIHPNTTNDVRCYITFVDNIIESERDVALLRSQGLIENAMCSDKKVVELFNITTKLGKANSYNRLGHLQWKMNAHCKKRRNKWRAIFMNNYLSNPWVFISLVAAFILLIATIMQTIYTVVPFYTSKG
ncbi:hypothetical protein PAHAL_8G199600 [Panicum hallii]|uniref:Uncharacterized protein n=1 Tax=Panicum hallii TaxID=206008 RepID=A0A270R4Q8_9POAL|nr:UPF0481 protein At3g47200-like [Panicum hallii]PVH34342.1 hypothetical protein PAHAL_8G199600 [Panicum hallii]